MWHIVIKYLYYKGVLSMILFIISIILSIVFAMITFFFLFRAFKHTKDKSNRFNILAAIGSLGLTIYFGINIKPPAPVILPLDNETRIYSDSAEIIIESGGFDIYYSLDGSDPQNGKKYENPIIITNSTTVSARSKFLWRWSEPTKSAYRFESIPITISNSVDSNIDDKFISLNELGDLAKIFGGLAVAGYLLKMGKDGLKDLFRF